jgi:hypothetical protein
MRAFLNNLMKKTSSLIALLSVFSFVSVAQTDVDALRYSSGSVAGTSRFAAMSGAFGALGGDFSSLSYNPAGIAVYRSSEFTFTPSIYTSSSNSYFLGNSFDERKYNFNIGNMGLIYTRKLTSNETSPGWKSWNFGIGYNRLTNYHTRNFYEGQNVGNSLLDHFAQQATGTNPTDLDPFFEALAYNTYLINPDASNHYTSVVPSGNVIQRRSMESRGAIGETVFTFGGNFSNKVFLGGTMGIKSLRYIESSTYEELDPDTQIYDFTSFKFQQDYSTRGAGIDLKFGIIYRANDIVRLGVAIHTPTWYSLHDETNNRMSSKFETGSVTSYSDEADGVYDYDFTSPFKALGSIAFVFGKYGLLSADYQFSDYGEARFNESSSSFADVNNYIRRKYAEVHTVRIGTEWLLENMSFRGGFSLATSPLKEIYKAGSSDFSKKTFSGGIGFRENDLFFDLGYVYSLSDEYFQPYTLNNEEVPGVKSRVVGSNFTATIGVKF